METGETGIPGALGQTVQQHVEVETKEEAGRDNVINLNRLMVEKIVREISKRKALRPVIQMSVVIVLLL